MSAEIGSVRATFTASASGLLGTIDQIVGKLGGFAAAQRRVAGDTAEYNAKVGELAEQLRSGRMNSEEYAEAVGKLQTRFRNIGEVERMRNATLALSEAEQEGKIDANALEAAYAKVGASIRNATPPIERLSLDLAKNRADFVAGRISMEQYERTIATLPGEINGVETEQQRMNRVFKESQETIKKLRTPLDEYETEMRKLQEQLDAGFISEKKFADGAKLAKDTLDKATPGVKSIGDAFGGLPGPLGAAARAFDMMQKSMGGTLAAFKSGGIKGGVSNFVGQVREGVADAGATGGGSLVGIAPQIGLVAAAAYAGVQGLKAMTAAMGEVGERVERTGQLAERMGMSFQEFEVLSVAANMAGVETEALASAQTKGLKAISAARAGAKEQALAFSALGISQKELQESDPSTLLESAAKKLIAVQDPATRAALALKIFGKSGNEVLPALKGIDEVRAGIQRLGGVMNEGDVGRFKALDDAFDNATRATVRLGETLLAPFTGLFQTIAEGVAATFGGIASALTPLSPLIDGILKPIGGIVQLAGEGLGLFGRFVGATISGIYQIVEGVTEIVSYSTTLAPIFQAVGAVGTFIYDTFISIGKEISEWIGWFEKLTGVQIKPLKGGVDREAIEEEMARRKELEKENEQAQNKAAERAKAVKESLLSPYQQVQGKVAELYDLEKRGLLTAKERAEAEKKITDEFVAQTPAGQALKKSQEDQKKAAESIAEAIANSASAGKELGSAADGIRDQFKSVAEDIKNNLEKNLIGPEEARKQMAEATDAMNEELKRLGADISFADKIRDQMKSAGEKVREELDAIEANQTLSREEKDRAKAMVREKAASSLPGGQADDPVSKFRRAQKDLEDAFRNGVIGKDELAERKARIRDEMNESVADFRDKQERNAGPDRRQVMSAEVNSSQGISTFFRILRGQDDPTAKQIAEMKRQTRLLEKVDEALRDREVVQI